MAVPQHGGTFPLFAVAREVLDYSEDCFAIPLK